MTEDERKILMDTHKIAKRLDEALMQPAATGEPPMIQRMNGVVVMVERSNWASRMIVRGFLVLGSLAGAVLAIRGVMK